MLVLDPRTAILSYEEQIIPDDDVLMFIDADFQLQMSPDSTTPLTLLTIKRLLLNYPSLQKLNAWAEALLEDAENIRPRLVTSTNLHPQSEGHGFTHLELKKTRIATFSELTLLSFELEVDDKIVNINGEVASNLTTKYADIPSVTVIDEVNFHGIKGSSRYSLSMTRLHEVFYLPIVLAEAENVQSMETATEDRTGIEHSATARVTIQQDDHEISLRELLHAVLMDINLDHEEIYEYEKDMLMKEIAQANQTSEAPDEAEAEPATTE
ncbi:hypothetical protein V0M98_38135 (plasmid) [Pseudomonas silesiensis]|uniref:hypothetical protein n=1 Tax=Pseudomonas silesiensis TaxID=1853130 RepID=UPI0030D4D532